MQHDPSGALAEAPVTTTLAADGTLSELKPSTALAPDQFIAPGVDETVPEGLLLAKPSIQTQIVTLLAVILPFAGLIAGIILLWGRGVDWLHLAMLGGGYVATVLGVTIGYHRYFTHKSFRTGRVMTAVLGILGSMSVEGPILTWVAKHRKHHQHTDRDHDPHSPVLHGEGAWNAIKGFFHAHVGWLFAAEPSSDYMKKYIPDLLSDKLTVRLSKLFPLWVVLGMLLPAGIALAVTQSWYSALLGFVWGGLVRIFLVHHVTWSVNSVCHLWGRQPFRTHDESRNNMVFAVLALGEGWHNNHHAFPASAKQGLEWWQVDVSYWVIRAGEALGLVRDVRVPDAARIEAKRATRAKP